MKKSAQSWTNWGDRLRDHVRHRQIAWGKLASDMKLAESTLRSWCNGTRQINLEDFFHLCAVAQADPQIILFGEIAIPAQQIEIIKSQIADSASTILSNTGNFEIRAASQQKSLKSHHRRGQKPT